MDRDKEYCIAHSKVNEMVAETREMMRKEFMECEFEILLAEITLNSQGLHRAAKLLLVGAAVIADAEMDSLRSEKGDLE